MLNANKLNFVAIGSVMASLTLSSTQKGQAIGVLAGLQTIPLIFATVICCKGGKLKEETVKEKYGTLY